MFTNFLSDLVLVIVKYEAVSERVLKLSQILFYLVIYFKTPMESSCTRLINSKPY